MKIWSLSFAIVSVAVSGFVAGNSMAQSSGTENLYSQYYTQPGVSIAHAEMYPAPHPVPAHVGHSYYTYQPLMPHEMMYTHSRNYYNFYASPSSFYCNMCGGPTYQPGYGMTKTSVRWQNGCTHIAPLAGTITPFSRIANCLNGLHAVRPPRPGLHGGLGAHLRAKHAHHAARAATGMEGGAVDGGCLDEGCPPDSDMDGTCENCEIMAANWQRAREQSAARTANSMSNRITR
jgi:hypothetical protein